MKTTNLKLAAFFVLVSSVLAGCSKSDPKPNYLGIYKVTVFNSTTTNGDPKRTTTSTTSSNVEVSKGLNNSVRFTDDLPIIGWGKTFEVMLNGDAFKLPLKSRASGAGKFTPNGFEMSTTEEASVVDGVQITTKDIKGTKL